MTLDEAIIHAEEQAELLEESARGCDLDDRVEKEIACKSGKCAAEHRQLAEWLKELREYKQQNVPDIRVGKTDFKPGDKFILELGTERKMFGEFEIAGTDLYVETSLLEKLKRYEPEMKTEKIPYKKPEIIYCKDCQYRDPEDKKCDHGHGIVWQLPRPDDWFCADGKV